MTLFLLYRDMGLLVFIIGLWIVSSAEIPPLIRQSNLFEVQGTEGEGEAAAIDVASSGDTPSYYADFELGCVTVEDIDDLSESQIFESAEDCCGAM